MRKGIRFQMEKLMRLSKGTWFLGGSVSDTCQHSLAQSQAATCLHIPVSGRCLLSHLGV